MRTVVGIGDVVAGKYEVRRILGSGGMGVVIAAWHRELEKLVALKFMRDHRSSSERGIERFLFEARAASRLQSEHVVRVLDVGRLPDQAPYIVMEYLEGQDLARLLEERGRLGVSDAVEYVVQVCEAMAEAHAQGIIHRDLKPQNLFLTTRADGRSLVKVLDFGISKVQCAEGTTTSQPIGSPAYMAPEQIRPSQSIDVRADIWSLGVILHELLSGSRPFTGDTAAEVLFKVLSEPPRLAPLHGVAPAGLVSAIERCLQKRPEDRFATVAELARELLPFTPGRARAALSLIEQVMEAGYPRKPDVPPDAELAAVIPGNEDTAAASRTVPDISMQDTLGQLASSVTRDPPPPLPRRRRIAITAAGLALVGAVTVLVMRTSAPSAPGPAPADVAIEPAATPRVVDAAIGPAPGRAEAAPAPVGTPAAAAAPLVEDRRAGPRRSHAVRSPKVVVDAGVPDAGGLDLAVELDFYKPTRTD
jgi:eukaryotic-like serine/threonine-protein kinase